MGHILVNVGVFSAVFWHVISCFGVKRARTSSVLNLILMAVLWFSVRFTVSGSGSHQCVLLVIASTAVSLAVFCGF